jgi:CBS domain-containing protein
VTKGIAGCYENGEVATLGIEVLSFNMPLEIIVIMPQQESARLLPLLEEMVDEGLMTVEEKEVHWHKCRRQMIPRQVRVKDVMTHDPQALVQEAPASEALRILLSARFHGIPVLDRPEHPGRHGHPRRPAPADPCRSRWACSAHFDLAHLEAMEKMLAGMRVADIMTRPVVVIKEDRLLSRAVDVMLLKDLKRLPVVAEDGGLTGILSRLDVFKTIMERNPDWMTFDHGGIKLSDVTVARRMPCAPTPRPCRPSPRCGTPSS